MQAQKEKCLYKDVVLRLSQIENFAEYKEKKSRLLLCLKAVVENTIEAFSI